MRKRKHVTIIGKTKHGNRNVVLLVFALLLILWNTGCPPGPGDIEATYRRFTPMVIEESRTADVKLELKIEGLPTEVRLHLQAGGSVELRDDGSGEDATAGDGIYTAAISMAHILHDFTPDDVNRNLVGFADLYSGSERIVRYNIFTDILTSDIPPVEIEVLSGNVQYTDHLVNIVDAGFFSSFSSSSITSTFYSYFPDNYDFINIIYEIPHFRNRYHAGIRNDVQGIGLSIFNNTATYGSSGRLKGMTVFPIATMFDGASPTYQHELGHQWINFLTVPPLDLAVPHWPLSDLASGLMGWGKGRNTQGLTFNFDIIHVSGDTYDLVSDYDPKVYTDLSLYLMGFIPPDEVADHFVFNDQDQEPAMGGNLSGPVTTITNTDIISHMGVRVPACTDAQKKFRIATIIVSKDGLLSENVMRLYDYFSVRAEETQIVPYSDGFEKGQTKPFYLSTQELGRLDTRIKHKILIDASRDGGVWWFPQAGPFDPTANHQGKALADYLRMVGYQVEELPRPYTITAALLANYNIIIRAVGFGEYSEAELTAYQDYVREGGNLLLLADHGSPDALAMSFGLRFEGATRGENLLSNYTPHPITQGLTAIFYNCGGGLTLYPSTTQILGRLSNLSYIDLNNNGSQDPGEPSGPDVLGIMTFGQGRIVFCGDANLWETVPQPLIDNTFQWFSGT